MNYILSIDPSTKRIGWAMLAYPLSPACLCELDAGWTYGSWPVEGVTLQQKMRSAGRLIKTLPVGDGQCVQLVAELPTFFSSEKGRIAAKEGYTINLAMILGYIMGKLEGGGVPTMFYTPGMWKGTVSKEITRKKFFRTFKDANANANAGWKGGVERTYDHDTVDAIMILRYWLGQREPGLAHVSAKR
jgi:hypothetical protein